MTFNIGKISGATDQYGRNQEEQRYDKIKKRQDDTKQGLDKLLNIYNNNLWENTNKYDFPYRSKLNVNDISRRYTPRILLGFGKYSGKTLYQVFLEDRNYFNWLFTESVVSFGHFKTSPKVKYTTKDTY